MSRRAAGCEWKHDLFVQIQGEVAIERWILGKLSRIHSNTDYSRIRSFLRETTDPTRHHIEYPSVNGKQLTIQARDRLYRAIVNMLDEPGE